MARDPRKGINLAGYISVAIGFIVGILPNLDWYLPNLGLASVVPLGVYSFIVGFVLYIILAKAGMEPEALPMPNEEQA